MPNADPNRKYDIQDALRRAGITQEEVAAATGFARSTVSKVIDGQFRNPAIERFIETRTGRSFFPAQQNAA